VNEPKPKYEYILVDKKKRRVLVPLMKMRRLVTHKWSKLKTRLMLDDGYTKRGGGYLGCNKENKI